MVVVVVLAAGVVVFEVVSFDVVAVAGVALSLQKSWPGLISFESLYYILER